MHKFLSFLILSLICVSISNTYAVTVFAQDHSKHNTPLYWVDPMEPDVHYDKPGKSSMGMELKPVYEEPINHEQPHEKEKNSEHNTHH